MKLLFKKLTFYYFKLLRRLLILLPERIKMWIGILIGKILEFASLKRRKITFDNIRKSSLSLDKKQIKKVVSGSYKNLGITMVELLTVDKYNYKSTNPKIKYKNIELIDEAQSRGKGVILLSGHLGNWEILAYSAGVLLGKSLNVVVKYQMNRYTDRYLRALRQRSGNKMLDMKKAGIPLVKHLTSNSIVAMLTDQRANKNEAIVSEFMGRKAYTYKAPATLALKFGSPIIVGFAVRQQDYTYEVELVELDHSDLSNNAEGIRTLTERYNKLLEVAIFKTPELWAWQHNRWKM